MEGVLRRLESLEDNVSDLKKAIKLSERKIRRLEGKLAQSQDKIKKLQEVKARPLPKSVAADSCNCQCGFNKAENVKLTRKLDEVAKKCNNLNHLQRILNSFILKAQDKPKVEKQIHTLQTKINELEKDFVDFAREAIVSMPQEMIRERKIPLNFDEYQTLAALEKMADLTERPAQNLYKKMVEQSDDVINYLSEEQNKLISKGVITQIDAVKEYKNRVSASKRSDLQNAKFFRVWDVTDIKRVSAKILAVRSDSIDMLSWKTKEISQSWSCIFHPLKKCVVDNFTDYVILEFGQRRITLKPGEKNSREVQTAILNRKTS